jgi:hypothetical protein
MGINNSNIDLSTVDSADFEQLAKRIEDFYRADSSMKTTLSYHWERNHLMLDGKQWIVYDGDKGKGGLWKTLQVSRANEYIPRPVTNYIFDVYQTLKSYLIQNKPRSTVTPNTQTYRDKMAAKLANLVAETNWERLKEEKNYEYAAACAITYGTVFKKTYWDTSTIMMAKVPKTEQQPIIEPNTGAMMGYEDKPVVDPETGDVIYDEIPLGDVNTAVIEPYRLALDPLATDLHNARWVMEYSIQPLDWVRQIYGRQEEGYTGKVDELEAEKTLSTEMRRFYALKNSSGVQSPGNLNVNNGSDEITENSVVLKEYYERPSEKFPKGRLVAVANGTVLYSGDSPYSGPELGDWHPYSEFRWELVPGRFWGKSPLDSIVEIQKQINSIDSAITLTRKTMAIPQKLIPTNSGVKRGEWTGRPGQEIHYRPDGTPPSTIAPVGVDPQVWKEREQKLEDIKAISGAMDILKGDRPAGVTAASALEMLFEVGTGKLRPCLDRWKVFVEGDQKKGLRLTAQKYKEPRPEFIKMLASRNKELPTEAINNFIGEDLYDNCNVRIEAGSNIPKLQSAEKELLIQLAQIGTLSLEDPANKLEFNKRLGIVGFDNEVGPDHRRAEWENDLMDNINVSPDKKPVVFADEKHEIHVDVHMRRMKEPAFLDQPKEVMDIYQQHIAEHQQYLDMQKTQAMQEAAVTGQPPAPQGPPPQKPVHGSGPGMGDAAQKAVLGSDLPKLHTA